MKGLELECVLFGVGGEHICIEGVMMSLEH
jgi:hypothetical protein